MKTAKPQHEAMTQFMHAGVVASAPGSKPNLHAEKTEDQAATAPLRVSDEERHRIIELALGYKAERRHIAPEFDLRDWLDAEAEVVRTRVH